MFKIKICWLLVKTTTKFASQLRGSSQRFNNVFSLAEDDTQWKNAVLRKKIERQWSKLGLETSGSWMSKDRRIGPLSNSSSLPGLTSLFEQSHAHHKSCQRILRSE